MDVCPLCVIRSPALRAVAVFNGTGQVVLRERLRPAGVVDLACDGGPHRCERLDRRTHTSTTSTNRRPAICGGDSMRGLWAWCLAALSPTASGIARLSDWFSGVGPAGACCFRRRHDRTEESTALGAAL